MARFKSHPLFFGVLVGLGLIIAAAFWWLIDRRGAAGQALGQLHRKERELHAFADVRPAPVAAVAEAVERERAELETALARMRAELSGRTAAAQAIFTAPPPAQRTDAFFDIARFVEAMREAARAAGVELRDNEMFGFTSHANSGPEPVHIAFVHRQRLVAAHLLEAVFAARPVRFERLERERPASPETGRARPATTGAGPAGGDFFEIDPRITARRAGVVDALAFRVSFSGQTNALRQFLNQIATIELPLLVRSVEVEPAGALDAGTAGGSRPSGPARAPAPAAEALLPIVAENFSRFVVTLEFIHLSAAPADAYR